ncbi:hypothetical protein Hanom_Chr04g00283321 [Helianthus anomalus]
MWFTFYNAFSPQLTKGFNKSKLTTNCVSKCKPQVPSMYFWKKLRTRYITKCKPQDHPCTFGKLRTKSKILINHRNYPHTLLNIVYKKNKMGTIHVLVVYMHICIYTNTSIENI